MFANSFKLRNLLLCILVISVIYIIIWYSTAEFILKTNLLEKLIYTTTDLVVVDPTQPENTEAVVDKTVELSCKDASISGFPFMFNVKCNKPTFIKEGYKYVSDDELNIVVPILLDKFIIILPKRIMVSTTRDNMNILNATFEKEREITFVLFKNVFKLYRAPDLYTNLSHIKKIQASFAPFDMIVNSNTIFGQFNIKSDQIQIGLDIDKSDDALESDLKLALINFSISDNALKELSPHRFTISSNFILHKSGFVDIKETKINADEFLKSSLKGSGSLIEHNFDLLLQIYDASKLFVYLEKLSFFGAIVVTSLIENSDVYNREENKLSYRILFNKNKFKFGGF